MSYKKCIREKVTLEMGLKYGKFSTENQYTYMENNNNMKGDDDTRTDYRNLTLDIWNERVA